MYLPLYVGKALHPDINLGENYQSDDTGNNISAKNAYYSELTALYWLWKNNDSAYKGIVHYRRLLGSKQLKNRMSRDPYQRVIQEPELSEILSQHDIVLAKKRNYYIESIYSHYAHTFHSERFDTCREVLIDLAPQYVEAWDRLMHSRNAHVFNMFVMRQKKFDEYCAWLFPILFELEKTEP